MADDVTLLPCKCEAMPQVEFSNVGYYYVTCSECGWTVACSETKTAAEAIRIWNASWSDVPNDVLAEKDARIADLEAQLAEAREWSSTLADAADDLRAELREAQQVLAAMQARTCETCRHAIMESPRICQCDYWNNGVSLLLKKDGCSRWQERGDVDADR